MIPLSCWVLFWILKYCTCTNSMINAQTIASRFFLSWDIWNDNFWLRMSRFHHSFHKFTVVCKFLLIEDVRESMQMIFNLFFIMFSAIYIFLWLYATIFLLCLDNWKMYKAFARNVLYTVLNNRFYWYVKFLPLK